MTQQQKPISPWVQYGWPLLVVTSLGVYEWADPSAPGYNLATIPAGIVIMTLVVAAFVAPFRRRR